MPIVKTGFSDVIGSWKIMLMSLPRIARISSHDSFEQVAAAEENLASDDLSRRVGNQPQDAQRRDALAGAGLADEAQHFARADVEVDAVDGLGDAGLGVEVRAQAANLSSGCARTYGDRRGGVSSQARVLLGIERLAHGFADEDDEQQREEQRAERKEHQPPLGQVLHALADQLAPARRRRRQAEAEEVERDERADVARR